MAKNILNLDAVPVPGDCIADTLYAVGNIQRSEAQALARRLVQLTQGEIQMQRTAQRLLQESIALRESMVELLADVKGAIADSPRPVKAVS